MNSKILEERIEEIEDQTAEMRLLKRTEKNFDSLADKEKQILSCDNSKTTVSMKHYDQLICDFRCPGCTSLLQAPIYLCMSGHSICRLCRVSVKDCPVCHEALSNIRSFTLERLSGKFQFPCKNLRNGCMVRLPLELMKWHEEKCVYKKTSCFMGKIWHDCDWHGRENEWLTHCKQKHSQKILQNQDSFELNWNLETLKHNAGPIIAYYLVQCFGETFNFYQIHEAKSKLLTWTVILANYKSGDKENENDEPVRELPKFYFELELYNKDDPRYLIIQRFPVHYEDSEEILDEGRCVKVSLKDIKRFLDLEKNLFYRVKIMSCSDTKDRWDHLLEKAIHHQYKSFAKDEDFAFNSAEDVPFITADEDNLVVIRQKPQNYRRDDDLLKQIYDREFSPSPKSFDVPRTIQKPPRKSLENVNSSSRKTSSSFSSRYGD